MIFEELEVLKTVVQRLNDASIQYIVSGSIAGNFYAQPRMTRDVDIVIQLAHSDIDKIYNLFKDDFYIDKISVAEALKGRGMFNIIHNEKVVKIDFIIAQDTDYERMKFQRKVIKKIDGINLDLISPEDLILSKLLWAKDSHSELQLKDVKNMISFNRNSLDLNYLKSWADRLSLNSLLNECYVF